MPTGNGQNEWMDRLVGRMVGWMESKQTVGPNWCTRGRRKKGTDRRECISPGAKAKASNTNTDNKTGDDNDDDNTSTWTLFTLALTHSHPQIIRVSVTQYQWPVPNGWAKRINNKSAQRVLVCMQWLQWNRWQMVSKNIHLAPEHSGRSVGWLV